jgi:hypothetical protein
MTSLVKVPVSVRLAPAMARRLRAAAAQRGVSMTSLVEQACERADWAALDVPEGPPVVPPEQCWSDHGSPMTPVPHAYHGGGL